jgi:hypothetical protein
MKEPRHCDRQEEEKNKRPVMPTDGIAGKHKPE